MTLNDLELRIMALNLRYFTEFGKLAFQLISVSSSIKLIDQKSAFIAQRGEVSVHN